MTDSLAQVEAFTHLERLYEGLDLARDEVEQATGKPVCVEKCGACCMVTTPVVTELEADYIISTLGTNPKFKEQVNNALNWMEYSIKGAKSKGLTQGDQLSEEVAITERQRCPFLAQDLSCSIHESRPAICRSYSVTLVPDDWCERPLGAMESRSKRAVLSSVGPHGKFLKQLQDRAVKASISVGKHTQGFLPLWITRVMAREELKDLIEHGRVSDAKLALGKPSLDLFANQDKMVQEIEQEQKDDNKSGRSKWRFSGQVG